VEKRKILDMEKYIKKMFHSSTDLKTRKFVSFGKINTIVCYFDTIVDTKRADREVILQLTQSTPPTKTCENADELINFAIENSIIVGQCETAQSESQVLEKMLNGFLAIYFENANQMLLVDVKNFQSRGIEEPPTSAVLKGPREGFNESIATNIMLLRKRLKSKDLVVKQMPIGNYSQTQVAIVYISSIASDAIVKEVEKNIKKIDIDGIIDAYYVQKALEERDYSLFKQVGSTEKPDVAVAKILEGRVAVVVDGTPMCLTVPFLLIEDIQSSNDYYFTRSPRVAFLRYLRAFGVLISIFLPGFYVALQVYHYKVVPLKFLVTIANSSQGIPFTPLMEVLFIIVLFEGLTEASLRMPRYLGLALSIVGALILGETAVNAGLVSPPAVMIVALTGVLLYTVPDQQAQLSVLRLIFTLVGGTLGLYGMVVFGVFLVGYLCNFDSYGTPYLAPFAPNIPADKKDAFKRVNLADMKTRPKSIPQKNEDRLGEL